MGGFQFKPFARNDEVLGQGKEVLLFAKAVRMSNYELDRIYHEFRRVEDPATHLVDISAVFDSGGKKIKYSFFSQLLYQLFDDHKTGRLSFVDYLVIQWGFLTTNDQLLAMLCFSLFDVEKADNLDRAEINYLVNVIWDFSPSQSAISAVQKLDSNPDGVVTLQEFVLLCKHHPEILAPILRIRTEMRKKIVFPRFWTDMMKKRLNNFGNKNILDLRPNPLGLNYVELSIDYLNLRNDVVPNQFIEQYRLVQKKKALGCHGVIEIPYELLEKENLKDKSDKK